MRQRLDPRRSFFFFFYAPFLQLPPLIRPPGSGPSSHLRLGWALPDRLQVFWPPAWEGIRTGRLMAMYLEMACMPRSICTVAGQGVGRLEPAKRRGSPRPSAVGGAFRLLGRSTLTGGRRGGGANEMRGPGVVHVPSMPHVHAQVGPGRADNNMMPCDGLGAGVKRPYPACVHRGGEPASLGWSEGRRIRGEARGVRGRDCLRPRAGPIQGLYLVLRAMRVIRPGLKYRRKQIGLVS